ncbi:PaaI family thioesterase [Nocardioides sp. DS6]|uniref:PaaI family thioesterase n=1 Tax=Nocardioides eburneus TaxID=3231482 RepID=A0ABV3SXT0_9ACTN
MTTDALQDQWWPTMTCFGCGPANKAGLQLKSFAQPDGTVTATFMPWPEHDNGGGYLNGGVIATLLDCHSAAAVHHTAFAAGWLPAPGQDLAYVTAGIDVRYRRPAPLTEAVTLVAETLEADEAQITAAVRLEWEGKVRAEAEALWKRWRPRA